MAAAVPVPPSCCDCRNPRGRGRRGMRHCLTFSQSPVLIPPPGKPPPTPATAIRYPKCPPHPLPVAQNRAFPRWESPGVTYHPTQSPTKGPPFGWWPKGWPKVPPLTSSLLAFLQPQWPPGCSHRESCQFGGGGTRDQSQGTGKQCPIPS